MKASTARHLALCLLLLPATVAAQDGMRWVLEGGASNPQLGALADVDCEDPDSGGVRYLSCRQSSAMESGGGTTWAVGFDYPLTQADDHGGGWSAGFRVGRFDTVAIEGSLPPEQGNSGEPEALFADLSSHYAVAQLRRDLALWPGGLRPYLAGGLGIARNSLRNPGRVGEDRRLDAPDGDHSGYLLRLSLGLSWRTENGVELGLVFRHDALDSYISGPGDGLVTENGAIETQGFEESRGRLSMQSVSLVLALPLGS